MKKLIAILSIAVLMLIAGIVQPVLADLVMNVDSGPWYLSDTAWFNQAKADTVNGTFVNLRTGTYPGTNNVDPVDFLNNNTFYTAGPKLLYWLYYIPNETVANIQAGDLLQTKLVIDWDGDEYALQPDHVNWGANNDAAWLAAGAMENYTDGTNTGVVGQIRFSWSAMANSVEAHREAVLAVQTLARGEIRYRSSPTAEWQYDTLQVNVVPEPGTLMLLVTAGLGLLTCVLRRRQN
jgi:hypothetical protein